MSIPTFTYEKMVDKDGNLTPAWANTLSQLLFVLQKIIGNNGFQITNLTTEQIAQLTGVPNGTSVYNTSIDEPQIKVAGAFKTITTS